MTRIRAGNVELSVTEQGAGAPLLLVHGFPLDHRMWQAQLDDLSDSFRVIAPDLRGFGGSDVTAGTVTMADFARDLNNLLDALQMDEPITLCGLSMGGYIAFAFAEQFPQRLKSLILCDTRSQADTPEAARDRLKAAETLHKTGGAPLFLTMRDKLFARQTLKENSDVVQRVHEMMTTADPAGIAAALRGMAERPDATPLLAGLDVPTLVICGEQDAISPPAEMRAIAEAMPRARYVEIAGAGHMTPMENPAAVNGAIRRFLAELE